MEKLNNTCCCYEGYAPFTKNGFCRFCFGINPVINNELFNKNKEEKPSKILLSLNIKQKILDLIKNTKL